jgi:hypothetical protein
VFDEANKRASCGELQPAHLQVLVYWFGVNETALVEGYAGKR